MLKEYDSAELSEQIAYCQLEPLPDEWILNAISCSVTANCQGAKTKPQDFMPIKEQKRQSQKEMLAVLRAVGGI